VKEALILIKIGYIASAKVRNCKLLYCSVSYPFIKVVQGAVLQATIIIITLYENNFDIIEE